VQVFGADAVQGRNHAAQNKISALVNARAFKGNDVGALFHDADALGSLAGLANGAEVLVGKGVAAGAGVDVSLGVQQVRRETFYVTFVLRKNMIRKSAGSFLPDSRER